MSILILGFPQDIHLHAVRWALDRVGADHQLLYTPDLPQRLRASIHMASDAPATARFDDGITRGASGGFDAAATATIRPSVSGVPRDEPSLTTTEAAPASASVTSATERIRSAAMFPRASAFVSASGRR